MIRSNLAGRMPASETGLPSIIDLVRRELTFAVFDPFVRDDIEQEIALWLLRSWVRLERVRSPKALAATLVRRFTRPRNASRWAVQEKVETANLRADPSPDHANWLDKRLALRAGLRALAAVDRRIARHLLRGATWVEACDAEGVPRGSRAFRRARIRRMLEGFAIRC